MTLDGRDLRDEIERLYTDEGMSGRQISKRLGIPEKAILTMLREWGVKIRSGRQYIEGRCAKYTGPPVPKHITTKMWSPEWWKQQDNAYGVAMRKHYPGQRFKDDPRAVRRL